MNRIRRADSEPVLALLKGEDLLAVCDSGPDSAQQEELSELLDRNREGTLLSHQRDRLEELMQHYRVALVRKAQAIKVAVSRGLRSPLS